MFASEMRPIFGGHREMKPICCVRIYVGWVGGGWGGTKWRCGGHNKNNQNCANINDQKRMSL